MTAHAARTPDAARRLGASVRHQDAGADAARADHRKGRSDRGQHPKPYRGNRAKVARPPVQGARIVARVGADSGYRRPVLTDTKAAARTLGIHVFEPDIMVLEKTRVGHPVPSD